MIKKLFGGPKRGAEGLAATGEPSEEARLLERKIAWSRLALLWERIWPRLWPPFAAAAVFVIVSFWGAWNFIPAWAHLPLLCLFALAGLASLVPLLRLQWPGREEALRRLEAKSGLKHRPATAYLDTLSGASRDTETQSLWRIHRERVAAQLARLRPAWPHPRTERLDPFALRVLLVLVLAVTLVARWPHSLDGLRVAFDVPEAKPAAQLRLDAWINPPVYTSKPPIVLAEGSRGISRADQTSFEVPERSVLLVRINRSGGADVRLRLKALETGQSLSTNDLRAPTADAAGESKTTLTRSVIAEVVSGDKTLAQWQIGIEPDRPPEIALTEPPSNTPRGALKLSYRVQDDYGVVQAEAVIERDPAGTDKNEAAKADGTPLKLPLPLPRANTSLGENRVYRDLTEHPWAGHRVRMILKARDQAGKQGQSGPITFILPERKFTKPLAKAVVEQRRRLMRSPGELAKVATALDALTLAGERFIEDKTVYLGLRSAYWRLTRSQPANAVAGVPELLWQIALRIEDGDLSDAERELRAAQERLEKALADNAPEQEIKRLIEEFKNALNRYMQALLKQAPDMPELAMPPGFGPNQVLRPQDLNRLLKNLEDLARTGARDQARQLLSELRDMLENLRSGRTADRNSPSEQMMELVRRLGGLITDQQKLLDDTYQRRRELDAERRGDGQGQRLGEGQQPPGTGQRRGQGQGPSQGEGRGQGESRGQGEGPFGALTGRQGELVDRLQSLLDELSRLGGKAPDQLNGARDAMENAGEALGESDGERATQQQTLALDRLRQGTQSMAEQALQALSAQFGRNGRERRDPMGRPMRSSGPDLGENVKVPDEIDIQRAREILEELRRRASEPLRPPIELQYLERLLKQF